MSKPSKTLINPESVMNLDIMKSLHLLPSKHRLITMKEIHAMETGHAVASPVKAEQIPKVTHHKKAVAKTKGKSPAKKMNEVSKVV
jgi:DNA polymerase III psi subunit